MFNEMGYNPPILVVSSSKKSSLLIMWNFFSRVTLRCLIGRSLGLDKAKLQFYFVMVVLYYGMKFDYASLLWDKFITYIKNLEKSTEIINARFWSLILNESYS